ncbi:MAG: GNAT family N-acetyltransferase [Anaerolineales bacterium]|nr:GNAT family N-acetyltransferase [Anaerolineales bacterium]
MTEDGICIEQVKVKDLVAFAEGVIAAARPGQFVPISMQRAVAHSRNPYASKEDVALLVALDEDDEVVGYFGILPLLLRRGEEYFKVHWFTTWNVSAKVRGRGVGSRLMEAALALGHDFLIVGSVHARRVCQKYGFWEREPLPYYWLEASGLGRLNPLVWLRRAYRKLLHLLGSQKLVAIETERSRALAQRLAPITRRWFYRWLLRATQPALAGIRVQEGTRLEKEPPRPVDQPQVELQRGLEVINWMLADPWVVACGESPTEAMDYYFSDARPSFSNIALQVYDQEDKYLGFVVFSLSETGTHTMLKLLDYRFTNPSQRRYALALAVQYASQAQADWIELPLEVGQHLAGSPGGRLLARLLLQPKERIYQAMPRAEDSPLAELWQQIELKLVDGDMAFS